MAKLTAKDILINELLNTNNFIASLDNLHLAIDVLNIKPVYPIILVGGTNGKGSTCAYLTNIFKLSGYKVGTYTSPHVFNYNERIKLNNQSISDEQLINCLSKIMLYSNKLGLFNTFTLAAHYFFIQKAVDIAIIEVGIGGRLDITNLFEPTISSITNVGYDHCEILGDTLEQIGLEKSGIFRAKKPAIFGDIKIPKSVKNYAKVIHANLQIFGKDFSVRLHEYSFDFLSKHNNYYTLPYPSLRGQEQINNASLAIAITNNLPQYPVSASAIKTAFLETKLIGRFQVLPGIPQIILDVAHNPQAITSMLRNMLKLPFAKSNIAVFGITKEKDLLTIAALCTNYFSKWYIAKISSSRGVDTDKMLEILQKYNIMPTNIISCANIKEAVLSAIKIATNEDRIVCFGSFLVVEDAFATVQFMRDGTNATPNF